MPRAKAIIQKVEELDYVTPNSILYNSLIDCLVKSGHKENASEAEHILLRMEDMSRSGNSNIRPNSYAYSMVMTCCARSKEPDAAERANRILLKMEKLYDEGYSDAAANSRCYSAAITAWARSTSPDAPNHAFALIDRMEENGRSGSPHSKPNAHCYNACIHAIAKSQMQGKATKCREVLQRMKAARDDGFYDSAPNLITYSTIINGECCKVGGYWRSTKFILSHFLAIFSSSFSMCVYEWRRRGEEGSFRPGPNLFSNPIRVKRYGPRCFILYQFLPCSCKTSQTRTNTRSVCPCYIPRRV